MEETPPQPAPRRPDAPPVRLHDAPRHAYYNEEGLARKEYRQLRERGTAANDFLYEMFTTWRQRRNALDALAGDGPPVADELIQEAKEKGPISTGEVNARFREYKRGLLASAAASIAEDHQEGKPPSTSILNWLQATNETTLYDVWLVGDWVAHYPHRNDMGPDRPPKPGFTKPATIAAFDQYLALIKEAAHAAGDWPKG